MVQRCVSRYLRSPPQYVNSSGMPETVNKNRLRHRRIIVVELLEYFSHDFC